MLLQERDNPVRKWTIAGEIAGADDPVGPHDRQVRPGQLEADGVAMEVGDDSQLHRPAPRDVLAGGGPASAASSAERRVASTTASMNAPRTPAFSRA